MCTYTLVYRLRFFFLVFIWFSAFLEVYDSTEKKMLRILQYRNVIERTNTNSINRRKKNNNKCEATHSTTIAITQTERNRTLPIIFLFSFDTLYFHPFHTVHIAIGGYSKLIWLFTFLTFACLLDVWFFCSLLPSSKYTINKDAIFPINNHKWRWILLN